jgi:hypothetical protein
MESDIMFCEVVRHGNVRLYVKRRGCRKVRLHSPPGTQAFLDQINKALIRAASHSHVSKSAPMRTVHTGALPSATSRHVTPYVYGLFSAPCGPKTQNAIKIRFGL